MTAVTVEALVWRRPPAVDRRFAGILLGSLALHAVVAVLLRQPEELPPPAPLQVSLRLAVQPAVPAAPATPPSAEPPAAAPRAAVAVPPKARQSVTREEPRPAARADVSAGPAIAAAAPAAPAAEAVAASAPAAAPVLAAAAKPAADQAAEALNAYRHQLTELFAKPHEYPRIAAMRGWEGEVRLRLKVARKGNLLGIQLDRSSGFEVLDRDALALLEGYGKLPPLPEAVDSNEISVVVPISYKLRKTT